MLKFFTAGIPLCAKDKNIVEGLREVKRLGLDGMEIEFVLGINLSPSLAKEVAEEAEALGLALSVHAPYYINLNAHDEKKLQDSKTRLLATARTGKLAGAKKVVFHAGFYLKDDPEIVFENIRRNVAEIRDALNHENNHIVLAPELTGKPTQWGSLKEILALSKEIPGVAPCIDFAHNHARHIGRYNSYEEFVKIFEDVENTLGAESLQDLHMHITGIRYGAKGELHHLDLVNSDLDYSAFLQAVKDKGVGGSLVCESPSNEGDAVMLKNHYESIP